MNNLIKLALVSLIILCMVNFSGCGGGGGGDYDGPAVITKGTATMVFSTALPVSSTDQIGEVQLKFELPAGVTVPTDASGAIPNGPGGVLKLSGEALKFAAQPNAAEPVLIGKYTPATATGKATINFAILVTPFNSKGMNSGEFATLACDLVPGVTIDLTAFKSIFVEIFNIAGAPLYDGVTKPPSASYTVTLQYPTLFVTTGATSGSGDI
ncbi:MAG: hypothetical protein ACOYL3_11270 [Desulfuromonadaceae bacterium]